MAEKKIIWKQKTGADSYDILYPRTLAENVTYGSGTVKNALDNIGTNLENKFVTLDTEQEITATKDFTNGITVNGGDSGGILLDEAGNDVPETKITNEGLTRTWADWDAPVEIFFPKKSGTLLVNGDIPDLSRTLVGSGNAVTDITVSGHSITVKKGTTFASTATATQSANGLMSSTDKKNLDDMVTLFGTTAGDADKVVNTVRELLALFDQYPEGTTITQALAGKADKSALDNYVTLDTAQTITETKVFKEQVVVGNSDRDGTAYANGKIIVYDVETMTSAPLLLPHKSGEIALTSDIPQSLPPSGNAGGDLTGTYPNPTIGAGAVTESKIGANAVTTGKIKDGNVTNAKLDTTGVTAGSYSIVTVNAQGRATAGSQLFTIGTASVIPSTVMTSAFYLQEVA